VPGLALPAFLLLGTLQGLKDLPEVKPVPVWSRGRRVVATLCTAVAGAAIWMQGLSLAACYLNDRANELAVPAPSSALQMARRAVRLSPFNAAYRATAGDRALGQRLYSEAVEHFQAAVDDDPYRASNHWRLARAELLDQGRTDAALQQFRQAVALDPTNPRYRNDLAQAEEKR